MKSDTLMLLELEHRRLRQVLGAIEHELDQAAEHREFEADIIRQALAYLSEYPDRCHHPKEDLIAARLTKALGKGRESDDLEAEHQALHDLTEEAVHAVSVGVDASETLDSLRQYVSAYRQHIQEENEHFFPTVIHTLSQRDLDEIDFQVFDSPDPIFDTAVEGQYSVLRRQILAHG